MRYGLSPSVKALERKLASDHRSPVANLAALVTGQRSTIRSSNSSDVPPSGTNQRSTTSLRATCRRVSGTAQRIVQNDSISSEVTQDFFIEVWRYAHRYDRTMGR